MNLFEKQNTDTILARIGSLQPNAAANWGKMNAAQMLAHCSVGLENALGYKESKRTLLGYLFGSWAKKQMLSAKPFDKNLPTDKSFIKKGEHDFSAEKEKLSVLIKEFHHKGEAGFTDKMHPFFGKMNAQEWSLLQGKHLDHHLRQFGA